MTVPSSTPPLAPFYYLASPYSRYPAGLDAAYTDVARLAGRLMALGYHVFSPIAHCHTAGRLEQLPPTHEFWLALDFKFIDRTDALLVAMLPGWDVSDGVTAEIDYARRTGKPVYFLNPETLEI